MIDSRIKDGLYLLCLCMSCVVNHVVIRFELLSDSQIVIFALISFTIIGAYVPVFHFQLIRVMCLQCFDAVGWAAG